MVRDTFGMARQYCVRYDGTETKVDVVGNLTTEELDRLIKTLQDARADRARFDEGKPLVITCSTCDGFTDSDAAHLHQGQYVGECCWDERLRTTE